MFICSLCVITPEINFKDKQYIVSEYFLLGKGHVKQNLVYFMRSYFEILRVFLLVLY